jgi:hypothetical protein
LSWVWQKPWLAAGVLAVALAAGIGLGIGVLSTGSQSDAEQAQASSFTAAYKQSFSEVRSLARKSGFVSGFNQGRRTGVRTGNFNGFDLGGGVAGLRLIEEQLAVAEAERAVAESELAERQANCGSIRRAPEICPTNAELESYRAAVAEARKPDKKPGNNRPDQGEGRTGG